MLADRSQRQPSWSCSAWPRCPTFCTPYCHAGYDLQDVATAWPMQLTVLAQYYPRKWFKQPGPVP